MLNQGGIDKEVSFTGDKVRVTPERAIGIFKPTCDHIVKHLKTIFGHRSVKGTDAILMVGGFSESKMLQSIIKENFPDKRIIIPEDAGLAVLKGAVIFGHNPSAIVARVAKHTYGVDTCRTFDPSKHPLEKMIIADGKQKCSDIFDKHVTIDDEVKVGLEFEQHIYTPLYAKSTKMAIDVYTTKSRNPKFVDERGSRNIGKLTVKLPDGQKSDKQVAVTLRYGDTELGVSAKVMKTGEVVKASFNFLG